MRKLATIQTIKEIKPIEGADKIEAARVNNWWVVIKKGDFNVNDKIIYIEIDAFIPESLAPYLKQRHYKGISGHVLKTIKLKGQLSQGLILPIPTHLTPTHLNAEIDDDVSAQLNIIKFEDETINNIDAADNFPYWGRKTDQERIQNCYETLVPHFKEAWVIEEKLDGTSCSVGYYNGELVICSRNLSLKLDSENLCTRTIKQTGILEALKEYKKNLMISGEIVGHGIQNNPYKLKENTWFVFDVFDVDNQIYLNLENRRKVLDDLNKLTSPNKLQTVPTIALLDSLTTCLFETISTDLTCENLLALADGESHLAKVPSEGYVAKKVTNGEVSFKAISNKYLLKGNKYLLK